MTIRYTAAYLANSLKSQLSLSRIVCQKLKLMITAKAPVSRVVENILAASQVKITV